MRDPPVGCRELDLLVHEILHVRSEHARVTAPAVRRHMEARLRDLEDRFDRTLREQVPDEGVRLAWRAHLQGHRPAPTEPRAVPLLLFRGRSEAGSWVEVEQSADDELPLAVDGAVVLRVTALDLVHDRGGWALTPPWATSTRRSPPEARRSRPSAPGSTGPEESRRGRTSGSSPPTGSATVTSR